MRLLVQTARLCEAAPEDTPAPWTCSPSFSGNSLLLFWSRDTSLYVFRVPSAADSNNDQQQQQQQQMLQQKGLNTRLLVARHGGHSEAVSIAKASPIHGLVLTGRHPRLAGRLASEPVSNTVA